MVEDRTLHQQIQQLVDPIFSILPLAYGGFDLVLDDDDQWWLVEINSSPNYKIFVRDNGAQPAIEVFKTVLQTLV
ncbi:MAG: hypothetical protein HC796_11235 [Synechococcaceae cyanobacterium RL_1_2]|nr:hypothetical protein [Synechococcaceae cyanobacterium RL_1_2]